MFLCVEATTTYRILCHGRMPAPIAKDDSWERWEIWPNKNSTETTEMFSRFYMGYERLCILYVLGYQQLLAIQGQPQTYSALPNPEMFGASFSDVILPKVHPIKLDQSIPKPYPKFQSVWRRCVLLQNMGHLGHLGHLDSVSENSGLLEHPWHWWPSFTNGNGLEQSLSKGWHNHICSDWKRQKRIQKVVSHPCPRYRNIKLSFSEHSMKIPLKSTGELIIIFITFHNVPYYFPGKKGNGILQLFLSQVLSGFSTDEQRPIIWMIGMRKKIA